LATGVAASAVTEREMVWSLMAASLLQDARK
jgi:hypothetical protein